ADAVPDAKNRMVGASSLINRCDMARLREICGRLGRGRVIDSPWEYLGVMGTLLHCNCRALLEQSGGNSPRAEIGAMLRRSDQTVGFLSDPHHPNWPKCASNLPGDDLVVVGAGRVSRLRCQLLVKTRCCSQRCTPAGESQIIVASRHSMSGSACLE